MSLDLWLGELVRRGGADLLLVEGAPAAIRIDGIVTRLDGPALVGTDIETMIAAVLPPHAARLYAAEGIADASYHTAQGRFRINLHRERRRPAAAIRLLPEHPPRLADLRFPPGVEALTRLQRGLVLVGGATGSGKTTTVAALIEEINRREGRHIVTIEDPIEYEHPHRESVVEQVEIGVDAPDFPTALRAAVRQAPDIIVLGEMRDPESMRIALSAAETGLLVFSTIHTTDAAATVARIADSFPDERQNTIRQELAMAASAILTQSLLPSRQGGRRVAAELLMVGYGARQHIRKNSLQNLHQEMTITRARGSFTLEESLAQLVRDEVIDREEAQTRAAHPDMLKELLRDYWPTIS